MSFAARFDLPDINEYNEMEEQCNSCPKREICYKLSYCAMEEY